MKEMSKYLFGLLIMIALPTFMFSQEDEDEEIDDFEEYEQPEGIRNIINDNQERFVFEITHDRYATDEPIKTKPLSRGLNVYYMKNIPLGDSKHWSVAPGLGLANTNVHTDNVYRYDLSSGDVTLPPVPDGLDKTISKFSHTYAEIPVELRLRSNPNKRGHAVKVATGFRAGYLISSRFKYKGQRFEGDPFKQEAGEGKYTEKFKVKKLENLVNYRVAPTFRVGYGAVNLFGLYSLNNVFETNKGPKINAYSIGLSISSF